MNEIATLLDRMRMLEPEVYVYGPASEDAIRQLEAAFGRPMPASYRAFLARFGAVGVLDSSYSGIIEDKIEQGRGWVWTDTKHARDWCQLPEHYLVVQPDEDGFKCLDFSRADAADEHPVVYHMPFRATPFHELADSYEAWLVERLTSMVEVWEEDAEPGAETDPIGR